MWNFIMFHKKTGSLPSTINSSFDVLKFFLSLIVVTIHVNLTSQILLPWSRIAVPLFFVISSYFLFSKINLTEKYDEQKLILKKYIFRNLKLYAFWFIALLPITLYYRKWFDAEIFVGFFKFVKAVLFQSTFRASWYIMATIIGTIIVFYLSK